MAGIGQQRERPEMMPPATSAMSVTVVSTPAQNSRRSLPVPAAA
jgi:hypothetical protein